MASVAMVLGPSFVSLGCNFRLLSLFLRHLVASVAMVLGAVVGFVVVYPPLSTCHLLPLLLFMHLLLLHFLFLSLSLVWQGCWGPRWFRWGCTVTTNYQLLPHTSVAMVLGPSLVSLGCTPPVALVVLEVPHGKRGNGAGAVVCFVGV